MKRPALLSFVIPTARYSKHLVKFLLFLNKLLNKYDRAFEIIIVSTSDNPANRLYSRLCNTTRSCRMIILYREKSVDMRSKQKNIGVKHSTGRYIYILDDDELPTTKLIDYLLTSAIPQNESDAFIHAMIPLPVSVWAKIRMLEKMLSSYNFYQSSSRILRRNLFLELGGYREDLVVGEDIEFQHRLSRRRPRIKIIPLSNGFEIHLGEFKRLAPYIIRAYRYGRYIRKLTKEIDIWRINKAYAFMPTSLTKTIKFFRQHFIVYMIYKLVISISTLVGLIMNYTKK